MKLRLYSLLFLLWSFCLQQAIAQDSYSEFQEIIQVYTSDSYLSLDIDYRYYKDTASTEAMDSMFIQLVKKGQQQYIKLPQLDMLNTGTKSIVVDHAHRYIRIGNQDSNTDGSTLMIDQIKTMVTEFGLELNLIEQGKYKMLRFSAPQKSNTIIELTYDPVTHFLQTGYFNIDLGDDTAHPLNGTRMKIQYSNYQTGKKTFPHKMSAYVVQHQGKLRATKQYIDYQVVETK